MEAKPSPTVRQCAIVDVEKLSDKFGGAQNTREEEIDLSEGFDGD